MLPTYRLSCYIVATSIQTPLSTFSIKRQLATNLVNFSDKTLKARIILPLLNKQRGLQWIPAPSQTTHRQPSSGTADPPSCSVSRRRSPHRIQTATKSRRKAERRFSLLYIKYTGPLEVHILQWNWNQQILVNSHP